ncbi:MAG: transglycosylase family protein [Actinomycetaceae bacterium]|nr:transglycosylase family protein [Actinomycetaceae bacterium]
MNQRNSSTLSWATNASRKAVLGVAAACALAVSAGAGVGVASSHASVTVEADGAITPVSVWGGTVSHAVDSANIEVGEHDVVTPSPNTRVQDGQKITIDRARSYTIAENGQKREVWSTASSLSEVMDVLRDSGRDAMLAADRSTTRDALPGVLGSSGTVQIRVDGETVEAEAKAGQSVPEILEAAGIEVSPIDRVFLDSQGATIVIDVTRVSRGVETTEETLAHSSVERETSDLYKGQSRVVAEGADGVKITKRYVQTVGDETLVDILISEEVTEPHDRIVEIGTKERPAVASAPAGGSGTGSAPAGVWAALAQCESGGNPATNTGNGYYGLYQFSASTWRAVGGSGLPSDASAAEQTQRAQILQQRAGWGQWPACARKLGLL